MVRFTICTFRHGETEELGDGVESDYCFIISKEALTSDRAKEIIKILNAQEIIE